MLSNSSIIIIVQIILSIDAEDAAVVSFPQLTAEATKGNREQVDGSSTRDALYVSAALNDNPITMNCGENLTSGTKCLYTATPQSKAPDELNHPSGNISNETPLNSKDDTASATKQVETTFVSLLHSTEGNSKTTSEMTMNRFSETADEWETGAIITSSTRTIEGFTTTDDCNMTIECYVEEGNATNSTDINNRSSNNENTTPLEETPLWRVIFDDVQVVCILMGTLTNLFTFITLFLNNAGFSRVILTLLRHQAIVDFFVCAMASTLILQPSHWLTGFYYFDVLVCYAWHSQALYWGGVTASTYNLILVAYERYLAVCRPFRHSEMSAWSRTTFAKVFLALYILTLIITHGCYIQTRLTETDCLNEYAVDGPGIQTYFFFFVIFTYLTTYLFPALLMGLCYGSVIRQLKLRQSDTTLGRSRRLTRANEQLTRTAIAVTIVFVCTVGYDLHYYLLGYTGVAVYELNTPIQKVGIFLSNINSSATPFVYAAVMPIFRRSVRQTLCCQVDGRRNARESQVSSSSAGSSGGQRKPPLRRSPPRTDSLDSWPSSEPTTTTTSVSQQSLDISVIELDPAEAGTYL